MTIKQWAIPFDNHTGGGQTPWKNLKKIQIAPGNSVFFKSMSLKTCAVVPPRIFPMLLGPGSFEFFLITSWKFLIQYPPGEVLFLYRKTGRLETPGRLETHYKIVNKILMTSYFFFLFSVPVQTRFSQKRIAGKKMKIENLREENWRKLTIFNALHIIEYCGQ